MSSFLPTYLLYTILAAIIILPLALMWFFRYWQRKDVLGDINSLICLLVSLPKEATADPHAASEPVKDFKGMIAPMEQFYSALTTIIHQRHFVDWLFSTPAHISFEIYSVGGVITFGIVCPRRIRTIVERQVHSFFPNAQINLGTPPKVFTTEQPNISGVVFEQGKNFVLPLKTYQYLEADPLSTLTTALTKLQGSGAAAIQMLIRPISDNWRMHTGIASGHVIANKMHLVNRSGTSRVIGTIGEALKTPKPEESSGYKQRSPAQEEVLKALQEKGNKTGFESIIRVVSTGETPQAAQENTKAIISAFSQFYSPQLNSLKYRQVEQKKIARDFLLRLFSRAPKMILNVEELASVYHFPNRHTETPGLKWVLAKALPAPSNLPKEGVVIGESNYRGEKHLVRLQEEDRRRHIFMIGKTGTGKTTLFETMIEQDMYNGKGLCFIDPLGDAVESLLKKVPTHRANDVIVFDPSDTEYPIGLNLLEYTKPEEKDFLIQEVIEIFYKLFDPNRTGIVGPQWEHWARNAALTVMSRPGGGSLIDLPRLFTDDGFREQSVSYVRDPVVKAFWEQQLAKTADFHKSEMYNYFISKFGRFMTNDLMRNIIGQTKSSFDLRELMDSGKILFVNLAKGKIGEINSNLLGLILVSKIQVAAFSRADTPEEQRKDFYLYVDEFQNFTTDTFATILAEARKYRLNLNITNQYFAQLTEHIRDAVIGNVGTLISYRIGAEDGEFLVKEMPGLTAEDLTNLDRFQAYVKLLIDLTPTKPFSLSGIKSPNAGTPEMVTWLKKATRVKYTKPPVIFSPTTKPAETEKNP
ncbi:MAG: type IV secretion system DNA-binding domain-containing protein [Candidatus Berkelbacteria bacterium]|nr:type IV secretion system DNA-binding domain-containing protein [Candidatus Berkelbacteria bacterium]MCR4307978.1 type IV secretion system DNA-binding domain-containing protein [Candidatus Berkelbacteria bacterium]